MQIHYDKTVVAYAYKQKDYYNAIHTILFHINKRASLACAARLADAACPQSYPVGAWR